VIPYASVRRALGTRGDGKVLGRVSQLEVAREETRKQEDALIRLERSVAEGGQQKGKNTRSRVWGFVGGGLEEERREGFLLVPGVYR